MGDGLRWMLGYGGRFSKSAHPPIPTSPCLYERTSGAVEAKHDHWRRPRAPAGDRGLGTATWLQELLLQGEGSAFHEESGFPVVRAALDGAKEHVLVRDGQGKYHDAVGHEDQLA